MKWIPRDKKPKTDCICYVTNTRAGSYCFITMYDKKYDIFRQYNPNIREHPALDVTHYIVLPWAPSANPRDK
jgi:hypothetical protein